MKMKAKTVNEYSQGGTGHDPQEGVDHNDIDMTFDIDEYGYVTFHYTAGNQKGELGVWAEDIADWAGLDPHADLDELTDDDILRFETEVMEPSEIEWETIEDDPDRYHDDRY